MEHAIANGQSLSGPALKAFFNISSAWGLNTAEEQILLGTPSRSTFFAWKKDKKANLSKDTLERISYILGIYRALQILLPNSKAADEWVKKPNTASIFGGNSALSRMLSGNVADLYIVRQYLDAQRGN